MPPWRRGGCVLWKNDKLIHSPLPRGIQIPVDPEGVVEAEGRVRDLPDRKPFRIPHGLSFYFSISQGASVRLFLLALEQNFGAPATRALMETLLIVTDNQRAWLEALREISGHTDPALPSWQLAAFRAILGKQERDRYRSRSTALFRAPHDRAPQGSFPAGCLAVRRQASERCCRPRSTSSGH